MTIGTLVVGLILLAVIALIVRGMFRDKKQGKTSCGGNCAHCGHQCCGGSSSQYSQFTMK